MDAWIWAVAGGVVAIIFILGLAYLTRDRRPNPAVAGADSSPELILGDMTEILAEGLPGETRDREQVSPLLARAGLYGANTLAEFRAIRAVFVLTPLFLAAAAMLLVEPGQMIYVAIAGVLLAGAGFSLPRLYVVMRGNERAREIERGLPLFADMLSIALLAGQGLTGALRRVTAQLREPFPQMAEELEIVCRQSELLNLHAAFEQWAKRSQSPEVSNLAMLLGQAQKLGNDITDALLEYANHLRTTNRQRADARAQRASFWMIFPTILCLWIPAAVLIVAPVYFEFREKRTSVREQLEKNSANPQVKEFFNRMKSGNNGKSPNQMGFTDSPNNNTINGK